MSLTQQQSNYLQKVSSNHVNYIYGSHYNLDEFLDRLGIMYLYQKEIIKNHIIKDSDDDGSARVFANAIIQELNKENKNKRSYGLLADTIIIDSIYGCEQELVRNEYRKFIEEGRFKRVEYRCGSLSIPRVQCTKSNGNSIKYASRRFPNDMVK